MPPRMTNPALSVPGVLDGLQVVAPAVGGGGARGVPDGRVRGELRGALGPWLERA